MTSLGMLHTGSGEIRPTSCRGPPSLWTNFCARTLCAYVAKEGLIFLGEPHTDVSVGQHVRSAAHLCCVGPRHCRGLAAMRRGHLSAGLRAAARTLSAPHAKHRDNA
jgi:hypothetical protein